MADPNASNLQGEASDDGWKRLKRLFDYALAKHTPGEEVGEAWCGAAQLHMPNMQGLLSLRQLPLGRCHSLHTVFCVLQLPPVPEELREWAQDTTMATFAGMFMGGGHQWLQERRAGVLVY